MPSATRDIKRRLRSVQNTKKITKAMELVASVKMRKASQATLAGRPYANEAWAMLQNLSKRTDPSRHPLLLDRPNPKKIGVVLVASSRGLVGGFNSNLVKAVAEALKDIHQNTGATASVILMGTKGRSIMYQHRHPISAEFTKEDIVTNMTSIRPMSKLAIDSYRQGEFDRVYVAYMDFVSTLLQKPVVRQLLPLVKPIEEIVSTAQTEYLFEPNPDDVLEFIIPRLVEMQIYRAVLETNASEHAARMVAMRNATDAAGDLIDDLSLSFNQARQAAITQDLAEISAGRAALES